MCYIWNHTIIIKCDISFQVWGHSFINIYFEHKVSFPIFPVYTGGFWAGNKMSSYIYQRLPTFFM